MINPQPLLFDCSFLVAYEQDKLRRTQAFLLEGLTDGRIMVAPALSLAVAATELRGHTRELSWLVDDPEGPLQVLPLSAMNALEIGALITEAGLVEAQRLELAHVVYEARAIRAVVITYEPKAYDSHRLDVIDMRPQ